MIVSTDKREFLTMQVPELLTKLSDNAEPKFGLMTAQHMIEHLTWVTKSSLAKNGQPEAELNDSQQFFKKFMSKGAVFQHSHTRLPICLSVARMGLPIRVIHSFYRILSLVE